jgi:glycosyltransferase involved in cell wall biosynthesis
MQKVSAVIITFNEERNIERCLESVRWADEIVVVDSFSKDRTVALARKYTDKIYQHEYPGSTRQMVRGIQYSDGDWILFVDADEVVSPELSEEIQMIMRAGTEHVGFELLRKPNMFGKWIEHGGWFPDWQFRFFRKDAYVVNHQEVHGGFDTGGPKGRLRNVVYHYTYQSLHDYYERMNEYTSLQVSNKLAEGRAGTIRWYNLLLSPVSHFLRMFVVRKGYKDGFHGFILAALDATYTLGLYAKLWEYTMQAGRGSQHRPPITNMELNRLKQLQ